ncbi:predicted protein [Micromonas commoda]|uniref:Uncharacterized protein n=1 Tax=Micromonas commoda (strain RCC299 / NOUM17 / CCMP2709) TaxID=296587 RepID=C1E2R4_MICCC|nr:predicted protein [Micromonas commoda]ACO61961.1 predicted protein [Micromonas commoda]|eukprot:XP_002500703.1 predicted protein [Micromonas commoda]
MTRGVCQRHHRASCSVRWTREISPSVIRIRRLCDETRHEASSPRSVPRRHPNHTVRAGSMPGENDAGEKSVSPSPAVFLTRTASRERR